MSDKKYIYNYTQAKFYMNHGVRCLDMNKHHTTGNQFWVFGTEDSQQAYEDWCALCKKSKENK